MVTAHDLLESFDSDTQADVLVLDFSKPFETVLHRKLLSKLEAYGIHGPILHWIANFLTQRKMSVVIEGESSHEVDVESGVPPENCIGGRESWLLCLICLPGVSLWLSGSSSRCHGVVCGL